MKNITQENLFKIVAIAILVGALWNHPYSYYQILRWIIAIASGYSAYMSFNAKDAFWGWIFVAMAVLFNPIAPIYLQKGTWQSLDLIGAIIFAISLFIKNKKSQ